MTTTIIIIGFVWVVLGGLGTIRLFGDALTPGPGRAANLEGATSCVTSRLTATACGLGVTASKKVSVAGSRGLGAAKNVLARLSWKVYGKAIVTDLLHEVIVGMSLRTAGGPVV